MEITTLIKTINLVFLGLLILGSILFLYRIEYIIMGFEEDKPLPKAKKQKKFAVLVPARNESNVISRILQSLKEQTYDKENFDVYVIVEDVKDKTVEIVKSFGYNYFVRKDLTKKGKGYAIDECLQEIFASGKDYGILAIADADNILAPNFLEEMNNANALGYQMGKSYHKQFNKEGNWVADCSTLTFSGINTFQNKARTKLGRNIVASGTGIFVDFEIIKELNGWPFNTLTEDYEMSLYMTIKNAKTIYVPTTYYYDEQPTNLKVLRKQRVRWIKGFSQARKKYSKELRRSLLKDKENKSSKIDILMGVIPNIILIVAVLLFVISMLGLSIYLSISGNILYEITLKYAFLCLVFVYIVLQIYTALQLFAEKEKTDYSFTNMIKILFLNPLFICLYIPHAIEAFLRKNVSWTPIEHGQADAILERTESVLTEDEEVISEQLR